MLARVAEKCYSNGEGVAHKAWQPVSTSGMAGGAASRCEAPSGAGEDSKGEGGVAAEEPARWELFFS